MIVSQMACRPVLVFLFLAFGTTVARNRLAAENAAPFIVGQEGIQNPSSTHPVYNRFSLKVMDQAGALIPHAHITIVDQTIGAINQKEADASGMAEFVLPHGQQYKATITAVGFKTYFETFTLESDSAKAVTLTLGSFCSGLCGEMSPQVEIPLDHVPLSAEIQLQPLQLLLLPARSIQHSHRHWL